MASLSVIFGKELSPQITDLYWDAMKPLAIEQFQEGGKSWIKHGKHFPKPADLLERWQQMQQTESRGPPPMPPPLAKWLALVNGLFMQYLTRRRVHEHFLGDIDVMARRAECLRLVALFESFGDDEDATEQLLKTQFDAAMKAISDKSDSPDWLPIELERQRQEDRDKARAHG